MLMDGQKNSSKMHNLESHFLAFASLRSHPPPKILAAPCYHFYQLLLSLYAIHKYVCVLCIFNHVYFQLKL